MYVTGDTCGLYEGLNGSYGASGDIATSHGGGGGSGLAGGGTGCGPFARADALVFRNAMCLA